MKFFTLKILLIIFPAVFLNFKKTDEIQNPVVVEIYRLKKDENFNNIKTSDFEHQLIFGQTKSSEINSEFILKLKKARYKRSKLKSDKISKISKFLNSKNEGRNNYETACKKVYRDIIIFKQENKMIKVIKICTSCYSNEVMTKEG